MKPQSALKTLAPLLKSPSFSRQEAIELGVTSSTLSHYVKAGTIERIARGVYRHCDAPTVNDIRWEDLVVAAQKIKGGIVCLISALALYELTDEMPRNYWIAIKHGTTHKKDRHVKLIRMRDVALGKTTFTIDQVQIPIFDLERTIVDAFRLLDREIAIKALKMAAKRKGIKKLNFKKLADYAKLLKVNIAPYILSVTT
jgi:predicted transcriptional regulator of viral defense system